MIEWSDDALDELVAAASQGRAQGERILRALRELDRTGRGDVKKLQGGDERWRLRVGNWRVIFRKQPGGIAVTRILNRRDAYDD
ncbi:MAG: type II toxin-antitoxin system RelE family toxin [Dehalococcoidia bacterium]